MKPQEFLTKKQEEIFVRFVLVLMIMILSCVCVMSFVFAEICDNVQEIVNIPCEVQTLELNCSSNVTIINQFKPEINGTFVINKTNPLCVSDCIYNFTFNYSTIGTYKLSACDNRYALINVVTQKTESTSYTNWVASSIPIDLEGSLKQQFKNLTLGFLEYLKEILTKFWYVLIAFIVLIILAVNKFKKKKTKNENKTIL